MTLSLTNPVENLLKVTLLKFEQDQKDTAKDDDAQDKENKPDQNVDNSDNKTEKEEQKENEEEKEKDEKKGEDEIKEKSAAECQEKAVEKDNKKESPVGAAVSKKPDRSMDNSCESRCFVPTAEVNMIKLPRYMFNSSLYPFTSKNAKFRTEEKVLNFILYNCPKQTVPHESTTQ